MSDVDYNDQQCGCIDNAVGWFKHSRDQFLKIEGPAGAGKTTIIKGIIEALQLSTGQVCYATLTNKAALVINRMHGLPCTTAHKLMYRPVLASDQDIKTLKEQIKTHRKQGLSIGDLEERLNALRTPDWQIHPASPLFDAELLVLDEFGMIDSKTATDLKDFGKKTILLGDSAQLSPVGERKSGFDDLPVNVRLTQIHRQALDSPIIAAATLVREGKRIPKGQFGHNVITFPLKAWTGEQLLHFDQIICGSHSTRRMLNNKMRVAAGFNSVLPVGPEEKILVTRTMHRANLYNGQFISLSNVEETKNDRIFTAEVTDEDGNHFEAPLRCYNGEYYNHFDVLRHGSKAAKPRIERREAEDQDMLRKGWLLETSPGYCITAYKAQGSQWNNVAVVDDWTWHPDHKKFLYTTITRAAAQLVILTV
jgi:AAA domain/UvrD-like helicase C-terminal domain